MVAFPGQVAKLAAGVIFLLLSAMACSQVPTGEESTGELTPAIHLASSPELLDLGARTYEKKCLPCHGKQGDGQGEAAYLLYPKPRNFVDANYRLISTWENIATDEDLFRIISRGMPGSAMPSWAHLPESTRWGLVHYIKSFSRFPFELGPDHQPENASDQPTGHVKIPPEPPFTIEARARAHEIYLEVCAGCHGDTGKGDGQEEQEDSEGFPTHPRDLTAGIYKGSPTPEQVYFRIAAGLPGSPMPSHLALYGDDIWHLVNYVREMSSDHQRARMEMKRFQIVATQTDKLPDHPDASIWRTTPAVNLHLMPLWWRDDRPEEIAVQALHDGNEIAIQLTWSDPTHDHTALRPQDFRDAAAIEVSADLDPPFFGMGEQGAEVDIWMWKSERQADLEPAFQDLDKIYPNIGIDSYPNLLRSPLEQPTRHALTLESDPDFVTGWGAHNIVSDPTRKSAAEDLVAHGFGTLKARPPLDQQVEATGVYSLGSYRVVFKRALAGGTGRVSLQPGETTLVSFAVWNGSAGDRDGKKSVTIWQELSISP
ncbi:ethylbenzene dehydrogenase-related protein [Acidobacteria bacterium AH-259-D05]|nr:ethylbenzene dehydrogenase-related protein [Acidobacteria bacterium AH-259-D05]